VGHVTAEKGIFDTIEAFDRIKQDMPTAKLDVVGIGPDLHRARNTVSRAGLRDSVTFHGWVPAGDELYRLYRDADVLLFLSRSATESFPRVISEAMAMSVLVVATPVGSLPALFRDEHDLLFVPIGNSTAAASAGSVRTLAIQPDLRHRLLKSGFERAKEFTLEYVTEALLSKIVDRWPELGVPNRRRIQGLRS
jgi:glycosyltransferase involved in cell wall biosynthesis